MTLVRAGGIVGGSLYLEVTAKGSKLWRWKYRIEGKENRYSIGAYPDVSLKEAREAAETARKLVKKGKLLQSMKGITGDRKHLFPHRDDRW